MEPSGKTTDERKTRIDAMGQDLGELHHDLFTEVQWLHFKWAAYCDLYRQSPEQKALLARVAPLFFANLDDILFDDIVLHISRLTDQPVFTKRTKKTKQKQYRLSLKSLVELIPEDGLKKQVGREVNDLCDICGSIRDWRDRWIGHRDLRAWREQDSKERPAVNLTDIDRILHGMRRVMNLVFTHFCQTEDNYCFISKPGMVSDLILTLEDSDPARLDKKEKERDLRLYGQRPIS